LRSDVTMDCRPTDVRIGIVFARSFPAARGKTHRLRVAAKSPGMLILGDVRYGGGRRKTSNTERESENGSNDGDSEDGERNRTYLHSLAPCTSIFVTMTTRRQ